MQGPGARHEGRVATVVERVASQSEGKVSVDVIEDRVRAEFAHWDGVPVDAYVPIFVERRVADALGLRRSPGGLATSLARAERLMTPGSGR